MQVSFNPYNTAAFDAVRAPAATRNVGLISRDILHKGDILTDPHLQSALTKHSDRTAAQVAFQFAAQENPASPVLAGLSSRAHLRDLMAAVSAPPLSTEDIEELRTLGQKYGPPS